MSVYYNSKDIEDLSVIVFDLIRGCSYGGELTRVGGPAHLGGVSRTLRNSYKNVASLYEKFASPSRWDLP